MINLSEVTQPTYAKNDRCALQNSAPNQPDNFDDAQKESAVDSIHRAANEYHGQTGELQSLIVTTTVDKVACQTHIQHPLRLTSCERRIFRRGGEEKIDGNVIGGTIVVHYK